MDVWLLFNGGGFVLESFHHSRIVLLDILAISFLQAFPPDRQSMEPQRSRCATVAATSSQLTCASAASGNVQNGCWTDLLFAIMYFPREGRCISSRCGGQPELATLLWIDGLGARFGQGTRLRLGPDSESFFVETVLRHARERTSPAPLNEHVLDCFLRSMVQFKCTSCDFGNLTL